MQITLDAALIVQAAYDYEKDNGEPPFDEVAMKMLDRAEFSLCMITLDKYDYSVLVDYLDKAE